MVLNSSLLCLVCVCVLGIWLRIQWILVVEKYVLIIRLVCCWINGLWLLVLSCLYSGWFCCDCYMIVLWIGCLVVLFYIMVVLCWLVMLMVVMWCGLICWWFNSLVIVVQMLVRILCGLCFIQFGLGNSWVNLCWVFLVMWLLWLNRIVCELVVFWLIVSMYCLFIIDFLVILCMLQ